MNDALNGSRGCVAILVDGCRTWISLLHSVDRCLGIEWDTLSLFGELVVLGIFLWSMSFSEQGRRVMVLFNFAVE